MLKKETKENAEEWLPNAAEAELLVDHCHLEMSSKCIYNHQTELPKKSETKKLLQHQPIIECLKTAKGIFPIPSKRVKFSFLVSLDLTFKSCQFQL